MNITKQTEQKKYAINKKMTKKQSGFTLIELMIVVAVIGVLAAVAIPQYQDYVAKTEAASIVSTLSGLKITTETHMAENGAFPATADITIPEMGMGKITLSTDEGVGSIEFAFGAEGRSSLFKEDDVIALTRTVGGAWSCTLDPKTGSKLSELAPRGCEEASEEE